MTASASPISAAAAPPTLTVGQRRGLLRGAWKLVIAAWKYLVGVLFCLSFLPSILVVGWVYRVMQRSALKRWWKRSSAQQVGMTFDAFVQSDTATRPHAHWPNWFFAQNASQTLHDASATPSAVKRFVKTGGGSLWLNVKLGAQGIFNTWVLTMPACALWLFAWYDGWNNSFNKGYEQALVGPLTGLLGVALFIAAMMYVPIAQARQAVTGNWKAFYDFKLVRTLIKRSWPTCLGLAALYVVAWLPVMILKTAPLGFDNTDAHRAMTDAQFLAFLQQFFFYAAMAVLPLFILVRLVATRIYASAVLSAVNDGAITLESLGECERAAMRRLNLIHVQPPRDRHAVVRAIGWTGTRLGRTLGGTAAVAVWFGFVALIFITEFLNYHPVVGWLNQALVQLPWFNYIPGGM